MHNAWILSGQRSLQEVRFENSGFLDVLFRVISWGS